MFDLIVSLFRGQAPIGPRLIRDHPQRMPECGEKRIEVTECDSARLKGYACVL
jgi:hypothetical protein